MLAMAQENHREILSQGIFYTIPVMGIRNRVPFSCPAASENPLATCFFLFSPSISFFFLGTRQATPDGTTGLSGGRWFLRGPVGGVA